MLAWLGGLGITPFDGVVSPSYSVFRNKIDICSKYFHYLYRTQLYLDEFAKKSTGIVPSRWRMYAQDFGQVLSIIPPIDEQRRISDYLDNKCSDINDLINKKEKTITLLKEKKQAIIQQTISRGLDLDTPLKKSGFDWIGKIPKHWEVVKIKYRLQEHSEKILSKESKLNYIGLENIESWNGQYIDSQYEAEGTANYFKKGAILFGKLRPYLAKVYLANDEGMCSTELMVFYAHNDNPRFIKYLLLQSTFISMVNASTYGSKMPRANPNFIKNISLAFPPLNEQNQIADYLDSIEKSTTLGINAIRKEIELMIEYKESLIEAVATGKIRV